MNILALQCRNCGAPLEFPARASHVRCRYCSSLMLVRKIDGRVNLDIVEPGQSIAVVVSADPALPALKDRLRVLDDDWEQQRQRLLKGLNGEQFHVVDRADYAYVAAIALLLLIACIVAVRFAGASGLVFMGLLGVLPVAFFIVRGGLNPRDSAHYLRKRREYEEQRGRIVSQIRSQFTSHGVDAEEVDLLPVSN